jgi:ubiquinone/menaquinone biosynthesis C-methylase UbiE
MATFDERAGEWDKSGRINMAAAISGKMIDELKPDTNSAAADIGAGTGLISLEISKLVKSVTAMDASSGMLSVLDKKISSGGIKNVKTVVFDADKDEAPSGAFDLVVSSMAMHHFKDTGAFAAKVFRMLKPGGRIGIADLEKEDGSFHSANSDGVMHNGFEKNRLEGTFRNAGFKNIRFTTAYTERRGNTNFPIFLMTGEKQ